MRLAVVIAIVLLATSPGASAESEAYAEAQRAYAERRFSEAARLFEIAAQTDVLSPKAKFFLGSHYLINLGSSPENEAKAAYWLKEPADQGFAWAQYYYAKAVQDPKVKVAYFEAAAQQGFEEASGNLVYWYREGPSQLRDEYRACLHEKVALRTDVAVRVDPIHNCLSRFPRERQKRLLSEVDSILAKQHQYKDFER